MPRVTARQVIGGVFFVHGLLFASWVAHIPHVKAQLGLSNGTLGLVLLATPVGSVSAMAVGAWVLPRVGSRRMVAVCLVGYATAGPFVGVADSAAGLAVALLCWGAFQGTLDVAMNTQAVAQERTAGQPIMSGVHGRWSIGALAGAGVGALGVWLGVSLTTQLAVLGAAVLLGVPLTARLPGDDVNGRAPGTAHVPLRRWPRTVVRLGAIAFASMLCEGAAADWSAVYLRDSLQAEPVVASLGYACFAFAMVLVRLRADRFLARHDMGRMLSLLAGVATVGFGGALLVGTPVVVLLGLAALGGGLAGVIPSVFSAAGKLPGVPSASGIAAVSASGWAGFVCGPPLIGQLAAATSLPVALGLIPLLTALIAIFARIGVGAGQRESLAAHS